VKDGEGYLTVQSAGGDSQTQCTLPVMLNYVLWGMPPQVAVEQPCFEIRNLWSMFTPYIDGRYHAGTTRLDSDFPEETIKGFEALGHKIQDGGKWAVGSRSTLLVLDPETGYVMGGSSVQGGDYVFGR